MLHLIRKYNRPTPRYTSYPTVPLWSHQPLEQAKWTSIVKKTFDDTREDGLSLYIHLPYCESLCTYCACNKRITTNHDVESTYLEAVLQEWALYLKLFGDRPMIREIHLGGGTPTFFSPQHLLELIQSILQQAEVHPQPEFSFEGHPNNTSYEHLNVLYVAGFRRVSFGIQDLNKEVQQAINRVQPFENVEKVTRWAREIGYTSVNFDFVYGLPFQNSHNLAQTLHTCLPLRPDRIAFYSYAHVPWTSKGQRAYSEADLPGELEKASMYLLGRRIFLDKGYEDIGMDHFALPHDPLTRAAHTGRLHRNFMGYTLAPGELLIGLGCSAISDARYGYAQNEKTVEGYRSRVALGQFPMCRGHLMTEEDLEVRQIIQHIACDREYFWSALDAGQEVALKELAADGIIEIGDNSLRVTDEGLLFLRTVCAVFDRRLHRRQEEKQLFSQAI